MKNGVPHFVNYITYVADDDDYCGVFLGAATARSCGGVVEVVVMLVVVVVVVVLVAGCVWLPSSDAPPFHQTFGHFALVYVVRFSSLTAL